MSEKKSGLLIGGAAVAAVAGIAAWRSYSKRFDFAGKVVLITGGSRGLGLVPARQFAQFGSRIAVCARDAGELGCEQSFAR